MRQSDSRQQPVNQQGSVRLMSFAVVVAKSDPESNEICYDHRRRYFLQVTDALSKSTSDKENFHRPRRRLYPKWPFAYHQLPCNPQVSNPHQRTTYH